MWLSEVTKDFENIGKYTFLWYLRVLLRIDSNGALLLFRTLQFLNKKKGFFYRVLYRVFNDRYNKVCGYLNLSLSPITSIGSGVVFPHGFPLVINSATKIGKNCIIHPCVLIGRDRGKDGAPVIGNNVFVGNGAKIIGNPCIGDWCFISPGAVITKNIPANSVVGFGLNNIINGDGKIHVEMYQK